MRLIRLNCTGLFIPPAVTRDRQRAFMNLIRRIYSTSAYSDVLRLILILRFSGPRNLTRVAKLTTSLNLDGFDGAAYVVVGWNGHRARKARRSRLLMRRLRFTSHRA